MTTKFIRFLISIVLFFSVTPALTQPGSANGYSVQHFTDENGLPQNSINDLLFYKDGYLWLASQVGLVRFNGSSFKLYYPDDKPVMESNIMYLGKNDQGTIYFQTDDHHLYRYPGNNNQVLSPVNTSALKAPYLLNGRKQLFDFSTFLLNTSSRPEADRRKLIFRYLFDNNENFYVADAGKAYLVYKDSLYYFDGKALNVLTGVAGRSTQYLLQDKRLYLIDGIMVTAVYEDGRKIRNESPIAGDFHNTPSMKAAIRQRFHLYTCGRTNHLLAGNDLYRLLPAKDGRLQALF